jgi:hypothetical protein
MSCFDNYSDGDDDVCKDSNTENAEELCTRIKHRTQELKGNPIFMENLKKFIDESTTPAVKADALGYINSTLKLDIPVDKITTTLAAGGECDTLGTVLQFNSINNYDKEGCDKIINDYIHTLPEGSKGKTDLKTFMGDTGVIFQNVTQENVSKIIQSCTSNTLTTLLQRSKLTLDKIALDDISKELRGVEVPDCSRQKTQVSSCNYIKAKKCCETRIGGNQINILDPRCSFSGTVRKVLQKNDSVMYVACMTDKDMPISIPDKPDDKNNGGEGDKTDYQYISTATVYVLWGVNFLILCLLMLVNGNKYFMVIIANLVVSLLILSGILLLTQVQKPPTVYPRTDFSLCDKMTIAEEDTLTYDESLAVMYGKDYKGFVFREGGVVTFLDKDFDRTKDCGENGEGGDKYKNIKNVKSVISPPFLVIPSNYKIHMVLAGVLAAVCIMALIWLKGFKKK